MSADVATIHWSKFHLLIVNDRWRKILWGKLDFNEPEIVYLWASVVINARAFSVWEEAFALHWDNNRLVRLLLLIVDETSHIELKMMWKIWFCLVFILLLTIKQFWTLFLLHFNQLSTDKWFFLCLFLSCIFLMLSQLKLYKKEENINTKKKIPTTNCLVSLVVLSGTATLEVLGSIPRSSRKCFCVFLWNSQ